MLASKLSFRRIIGVEFATELHEAAKNNLAVLDTCNLANSQIELVCEDASNYVLPIEPLIIYLFNPFGSAIVRRVAENALTSWRNSRRPVYILYMNPVHLVDFTNSGWILLDRKHSYVSLIPQC
jgi:predicted RNA methylase